MFGDYSETRSTPPRACKKIGNCLVAKTLIDSRFLMEIFTNKLRLRKFKFVKKLEPRVLI